MPVISIMDDFDIYRRHLPHWRLQGAIYFVTWRLHAGLPPLRPAERQVVQSTLMHFNCERYELSAFVVMDDHVHVLVRPLKEYSLRAIVHTWKSFTAHRLQQECGRVGRIWQDESFDRIVRNEEELIEKATYILNNPHRRWPGWTDYPWRYPIIC